MGRSRRGVSLITSALLFIGGVITWSAAPATADPTVPDAPTIGTAIGGDASATVAWTPPVSDGGSPVVVYVVTAYVGYTPAVSVFALPTKTQQQVTGLSNGTTYRFRVRAFNAVGPGGYSKTSNAVTPAAVTPVAQQIASGGRQTCVIVAGGAVDCWGSGPLGDGTTADSHVPVQVTGLTGATAIAVGGGSTCALIADGTVDCWGSNSQGQLGNGTTTNSLIPTPVTGLSGVTAITAENAQACAVVATGGAYCWGFNYNGQLGNGTTTNSLTPTPVTGLTGAVDIATGGTHTCAVTSDGTVYCWGFGGNGAIGGSTTSLVPRVVAGVTGATAVTGGLDHSCVLVAGGAGYCWGANGFGQLGLGVFTPPEYQPWPIFGLSGATTIASFWDHTCASLVDGTAKCWGENAEGQLGIGSIPTCDPDTNPNCHLGKSTPQTVVGLTQVTGVATGDTHSCALVAGGGVYCWGDNDHGQLGDGTTTWSTTPVAVIWP